MAAAEFHRAIDHPRRRAAQDQRRDQPRVPGCRRRHALSSAARHRLRQSPRRDRSAIGTEHPDRRSAWSSPATPILFATICSRCTRSANATCRFVSSPSRASPAIRSDIRLGAATFTCGLVRFRVYSFWNLTVVDITKIAFMTGMTFWLGNAFVLGGAVAYAPAGLVRRRSAAAVAQPRDRLWRTVRGCLLSGWLAPRRRTVGRADWQIVLPGLRGTFLQIGIGTLDRLLGVVVALHFAADHPRRRLRHCRRRLRPRHASRRGQPHAGKPRRGRGGILIGLPQYQREDLLASLLTFRVLDFFLPLFLAMADVRIAGTSVVGTAPWTRSPNLVRRSQPR